MNFYNKALYSLLLKNKDCDPYTVEGFLEKIDLESFTNCDWLIVDLFFVYRNDNTKDKKIFTTVYNNMADRKIYFEYVGYIMINNHEFYKAVDEYDEISKFLYKLLSFVDINILENLKYSGKFENFIYNHDLYALYVLLKQYQNEIGSLSKDDQEEFYQNLFNLLVEDVNWKMISFYIESFKFEK